MARDRRHGFPCDVRYSLKHSLIIVQSRAGLKASPAKTRYSAPNDGEQQPCDLVLRALVPSSNLESLMGRLSFVHRRLDFVLMTFWLLLEYAT